MSKNILDVIKQQIEDQTKDSINLDVNNTPPISVSTEEGGRIVFNTPLVPVWTHVTYSMWRNGPFTSMESFMHFADFGQTVLYSRENIIGTGELSTVQIFNGEGTQNHLFGIKVFSKQAQSMKMVSWIGNVPGFFTSVFRRDTSSEQWELVISAEIGSVFDVPLTPNSWNDIAVLVYIPYQIGDGIILVVGGDFTGITRTKPLDERPIWTDTNPFNAPAFATVSKDIPSWKGSLEPIVIEHKGSKPAIRLSWEKKTDIALKGTGIFRKSSLITNVLAERAIPATVITTTEVSPQRVNNFLAITPNATIGIGDKIAFSSGGTEYRVSDFKIIKPNLVPNPIFTNGNTNWTFDIADATIESDLNAALGNSYLHVASLVTNSRLSVTSTFIPVAQGTRYNLGFSYNSNPFLNRHYGAGGYAIPVTDWTTSGSIDSATATLAGNFQNIPVMEVARSEASPGQIRTDGLPFYLSTAATYSLTTIASFRKADYYTVSFRNTSGATVFTTGSLLAGGKSFLPEVTQFAPSITGEVYAQINVFGTMATLMQFGMFGLKDRYATASTNDLDEFLEISFFTSSKVPCVATPRNPLLFLKSEDSFVSHYTSIATTAPISNKLPTTCSFVKLSYVASVNAVPMKIDKRINNFVVNQSTEENKNKSIFATQYTWIQTTATVSFTVGSLINLVQFEHLVDRDTKSSDGNIITWDDFNVENNVVYSYHLDSYDGIKNRSPLSVVATVNSSNFAIPTWATDTKHKYWSSQAQAKPAYNHLVWDNSRITSGTAVKKETLIYRAEITPLNDNPIFRIGNVNEEPPPSWEMLHVLATTIAIIDESISYNEHRSLKVTYDPDVTSVSRLDPTTNSWGATPNDTFTALFRWALASPSNVFTWPLLRGLSTGEPVFAGVAISNQSTATNSWLSSETTYTIPATAAAVTLMRFRPRTEGDTNSIVYYDDLVVFKNPVFSTIAVLGSTISEYDDTDIVPFKSYIYYTKINDYFQGVSNRSNYKYIRAVTDNRDVYKNLIQNSSFERLHVTAGGTIQPDSWVHYGSVGLFDIQDNGHSYITQVILNGGSDGEVYVKASFISAGTIISQNNIHINHPLTGDPIVPRTFVASAYIANKEVGGGTADSVFTITGFNSSKEAVSTKFILVATTSTSWVRTSLATFVAVPSITNFDISLRGSFSSGIPVSWDAIQFEEKESFPPRPYHDGDMIELEKLTGKFISAPMIAASQIFGGHVRAQQIVADHILADSLTSNELKLANTNIMINGPEFSLSAPHASNSDSPATLSNIHLVLSTLQSGSASQGWGYIGPFFGQRGSNATMYMGRWTSTGQLISFKSVPTLTDSNWDTCKMVLNPATGTALMICSNGSLNSDTQDVLRKAKGTRGTSTEDERWMRASNTWEVPSFFSQNANINSLKLKLSLSSTATPFHYISLQTSKRIKWVQFDNLGNTGSIYTITGTTTTFDVGAPQFHASVSFDSSPTGTFLFAFCGDSTVVTGSPTINFFNKTIRNVTNGTFRISTHSGGNTDLEERDKFAPKAIDLTYINNNKFLLTYSLEHDSLLYYKVIDGEGNVLAGLNTDLAYGSSEIADLGPEHSIGSAPNKYNGANHQTILALDGGILSYISVKPYSNEGIDLRRKHGKGQYLYKTQTTVSLEDIFNRIA